jgi:hypothetical protein
MIDGHATLHEFQSSPPGTVFTERRYLARPIMLTSGLERPGRTPEYRTDNPARGTAADYQARLDKLERLILNEG